MEIIGNSNKFELYSFQISVIDKEGSSILYQKQIGTELSADVISLKFETSNIHGFEKNILVIATRDSSVLALDADSGNTLSSSTVHPKKPSRALYMQTLGNLDLFSGVPVVTFSQLYSTNYFRTLISLN